MFKQWKRYHLLIMCVALALITTACFRDSAEGVAAQPVSQLLPTDTLVPIQEEPSATPTELIEATEEVIFEKPTETSTATSTATPTIFVPVDTATMTIDPLLARLTATETEEGIVNVGNTIPGGTPVAQVGTPAEAAPDTFALTSTALIGQLTQDAADAATAEAIRQGVGVATATPLGPPTQDPFATATFVPAQGLVPGADCVHQIRAGETLYKLSLAYGVSVGEMANASGITNWNIILIGQRITIPSCGTTGFAPPPTSIPVPSSTPVIADQASAQSAVVTGAGDSSATTDTLAAQAQSDIVTNAQADIQANAVAQGAVPLVGRTQYTVQQYDTLFQIAQAHNTTVDAIATLNGITNINSITMNTVLQIP